MNMPKISIIIPVYNSEKYLLRCLNSIVNQTFRDIEIICIDDCSTDDSIKILKSFEQKDNRIKILYNDKNSGPSFSRNSGMSIAQGDYIGFVDSDDYIDNDFYEKLYFAAKKYDADIAACGIKRLKKNKEKFYLKFEKEIVCEDNFEKFILCDVPDKCYVWNRIYKLSNLKKNNILFEHDVYFEDRCFTAEVLIKLKRLVVVPNVFYNYWVNPKSIVKTKSPKKAADSYYTKEKMKNIMLQNNINIRYEIKRYGIFGLTLFKIKYYGNKKFLTIFNQIKLRLS